MDKANLYYENISHLAGRIRKGDISSTELVESLLARVESLDDKLNAFQQITDWHKQTPDLSWTVDG